MKYYRLLWLLPAPFLLYALWVLTAFVFGLGTVSIDMCVRAIVALGVLLVLSLPAFIAEVRHD